MQHGHTRIGAAWRAVVTLAVAVLAIAAAAWAGSFLVGYDTRLGMVAAVPAAAVVGSMAVGWSRARLGFLPAPLFGTLVAVLAGASLLHGHRDVVAGGRLRLDRLSHSHLALYERWMLVAGTAVVLVSVVWAAVSGRRHPRRPKAGSALPSSESSADRST